MADNVRPIRPLQLLQGNGTPETRCILSCECGSSNYELAGSGQGNSGQVRCARCRTLKDITWRFTGEQPDPVRA